MANAVYRTLYGADVKRAKAAVDKRQRNLVLS